jgi:hypothetical protein
MCKMARRGRDWPSSTAVVVDWKDVSRNECILPFEYNVHGAAHELAVSTSAITTLAAFSQLSKSTAKRPERDELQSAIPADV